MLQNSLSHNRIFAPFYSFFKTKQICWNYLVSRGPGTLRGQALRWLCFCCFGLAANLACRVHWEPCVLCAAQVKRCLFFNVNWHNQLWNVVFVLGGLAGGFIAGQWLNSGADIQISQATVQDLQALGITNFSGLAPAEIFGTDQILTLRGFIFLVIGGFLVGFGTRYAGGCTSGHAISGLSNLQLPSLIAVIGFFIGGLLMTHVLLPFLIGL